MVELPWQVVAIVVVAVVVLFGLQQILHYLRRRNCSELVDAEKRIQHQFTMRCYRDGFETGLTDGKNLQALVERKKDNKDA